MYSPPCRRPDSLEKKAPRVNPVSSSKLTHPEARDGLPFRALLFGMDRFFSALDIAGGKIKTQAWDDWCLRT